MAGRTRALTETAALSALAALLFLVAQVPLVGPIICLGCPFPVTLAFYRHGFRTGMAGVGVLALLLFVTQGGLAALAIPFVWTGLLLGLLLRARRTPLECLALGSLGLGALLFLGAWGYENGLAGHLGTPTLRDALVGMIGRLHERAMVWGAGFEGVPPAEFGESALAAVLGNLRRSGELLAQAFAWMPLAVMAFMGAFAFRVYLAAAGPVLRRLQVPIEPVPPLRAWRLPGRVALLPALLLLAELLPEVVAALEPHARIPYLRFGVMNLWVVAGVLYALLGAAVVDARLVGWGLPWPLARVLEGIACLVPLPGGVLGMQLMALLGLVDSWWSLRPARPAAVASQEGPAAGGESHEENHGGAAPA